MTIFRQEKGNRYDTTLYCKPTINFNQVFINNAKQFLRIIKSQMLKRNCKKQLQEVLLIDLNINNKKNHDI